MRKRTDEINVRVYPTEKRLIRRKAKKCGITMSAYLRSLGTDTAVKSAPNENLMLAYLSANEKKAIRGQAVPGEELSSLSR